MLDLTPHRNLIAQSSALRFQGRVVQVVGLSIAVEGLRLPMGDICHVYPERSTAGGSRITAEVVGFRDDRLILMPFSDTHGVRPGTAVFPSGRGFSVPVGEELLGRVIDGLARPIDGKGPLNTSRAMRITDAPPSPLARLPIRQPLATGVRALDAMLTTGRGQRMGIFAGSGVGKSTLLGMIARNCDADVNVIALIGERGREVQEFIQRDLGREGLARSVVVVSTSDQPALQRLKGAWVATAIAEWFRGHGQQVTLMMDSVTRFAMAQREIGLTVGEPPVARGYPPSVFAMLPRLLERAGTAERGAITGLYTVLVEGDDMQDPIADTVRGILDGHIVLSRTLAQENHYPAIDVLQSVSRLFSTLASPDHQAAASVVRDAMFAYQQSRDLINIGAYVAGSNSQIDRAMRLQPHIQRFLRQAPDSPTPLTEAIARLCSIANEELSDGATA
ncbi:MAG: FliI/YscN family ATPase [Chloroflexota bacterium]|nr:FliI/YscN family ATPase [Chloroflexota bacterium]